MNLVPVHTFGIDPEEELLKILRSYPVKKVMIIRNDDSERLDNAFKSFIGRLKSQFPYLSIECDLCICGSNNGHCRLYNNRVYDSAATVRLFIEKMNKILSCGINGIVMSDMNLDTLCAVQQIIDGSGVSLSAEIKQQTDLYNAYRAKSGMPRIIKEYHLIPGDYQLVSDFLQYTDHLILKPALTMYHVLQYIIATKNTTRCSVFLTTAEGQMLTYLYTKYRIRVLGELLKQYELLGIFCVYLPENILLLLHDEEETI